jgi:hypothetical protein
MRLHYITHWYRDADPRRCEEQAEAIRRQAAQADSFTVLAVDDGCPLAAVRIDHRPTFAELVAQARPDAINLLANSDCYLAAPEQLQNLCEHEAWCLSRADQCVACSQDAWAWRGRIWLRGDGGDYTQGIPGCDNQFAFDLAAAGMLPTNPARSVTLHHLHASSIRRYSEIGRLPHPYLFVEPVELGQQSRLEFRGAPADAARIARLQHLFTDLKQ